MPPGGAGLYYFFIQILSSVGEEVGVDLRWNGEEQCRAYGGNRDETDPNSHSSGSCGAVLYLAEGKV